MKTTKTIKTREQLDPTTPDTNIDELAKLWVELVLQQIQKNPVLFSKYSTYNNVI